MRKILVLVEGQTEEQFTKKNLCEACFDSGLQFIPVILSTKKTKIGNKFRGGVSTYSKMKKEVLMLLHDSSAAAVTTLFDYYVVFPDYMKSIHGPLITGRIGLDEIRSKCMHFNQWLTAVESV